MSQQTGNTTASRSSGNRLLQLAILVLVIAGLSGHLVQILRFLLSLLMTAAVIVGMWVIIEILSSSSARSTGGSQAPAAQARTTQTSAPAAEPRPTPTGGRTGRTREARTPVQSGSTAPHRRGVGRPNVRGTSAQQQPGGGRISVVSAQAAPRDGRPHLLVLGPEHTQYLTRVDPYTRTSFQVGEQVVCCGGCGNLYKLVTCEALEHRCPNDGASLRPTS